MAGRWRGSEGGGGRVARGYLVLCCAPGAAGPCGAVRGGFSPTELWVNVKGVGREGGERSGGWMEVGRGLRRYHLPKKKKKKIKTKM